MTIEEQLQKEGVLIYPNKGVSMMPLLRQGKDLMVIRRKTEGFVKNEAALFRRDNGQLVMHRVQKVRPDGYFIIGDNCLHGEFVRGDQMLGTLEAVVRDGVRMEVTDKKYLRYVRTRVFHHLWLYVKFYFPTPKRVWNKLKKIF